MNRRILVAGALLGTLVAAAGASAQTPQPFPRPGDTARPQPPPRPPVPDVSTTPAEPQPAADNDPNVPSPEKLGLPVYPGAQFLTSYDAGRGQRFYLFGTNVEFPEIVAYYRTVLKQRGSLVYEQPGLHTFEVGRYRSDAVAFPPGVAVKDYTWGSSPGYLNPLPGVEPAYFRTVIQIVPPPAGTAGGR